MRKGIRKLIMMTAVLLAACLLTGIAAAEENWLDAFELPEYKQLLKDLGIEGEWEGIGHCAVGFMDCELPKPPERKPGRVFWAE